MPKDTAAAPRRNKRKKDPEKPKRALSAYMFFAIDQRDSVKERNPQAGFGEIGKLLGQEWKSLSDDKKKPYLEKASKDKERYNRENKSREHNGINDTVTSTAILLLVLLDS
ncbi:nonhistone chromosomal protein 6A [Syncephalis fuscata]|nr:nonhistone chromosomal protein 6A [Syncephalis fuscata]